MKQVTKLFIGSLLLASVISACSKKDSNNVAATTAAVGGICGLSNGVCISGVTGGQVGIGSWTGRLMVSNVAQYQALLEANGVCSRQLGIATGLPTYRPQQYGRVPCAQMAIYFDLTVRTVEEVLPGQAIFSIRAPFANRSGGMEIRGNAQAFMNSALNGFQLAYAPDYSQNYAQGWNNRTVGGRPRVIPVNQQTIVAPLALQIVLTYADATRTLLAANVTYGSVLIATTQQTMPLRGRYTGQFSTVAGQYQPNAYSPQTYSAPAILPYGAR